MEPIRLVSNGRDLVLPDGFGLELEEFSSAFDPEGIDEPFSIGLDLPLEGNEWFFGAIAELGGVRTDFSYEVTLIKGALVFQNATILVETVAIDELGFVDLDCTILFKALSRDLLAAILCDMDMGQVTLATPIHLDMKIYNLIPLSDENIIRFPIAQNQKLFNESDVPHWMGSGSINPYGLVNLWNSDTQNFFEPSWIQPELTPICPFVHIVYALKKSLANFGFTVDGSALSDERLQREIIPSARPLPANPFLYIERLTPLPSPQPNTNLTWLEDWVISDPEQIASVNPSRLTFPEVGDYDIRVTVNRLSNDSSADTIRIVDPVDNSVVGSFTLTAGSNTTSFGTWNIPSGKVGLPLRINIVNGDVSRPIQAIRISIKRASESVFDPIIRINEHLPSISIQDLLIRMKTQFGLRFSIRPFTQEISVFYINDDLKAGNYQDLKTIGRQMIIDRDPEVSYAFKPSFFSGKEFEVQSQFPVQEVTFLDPVNTSIPEVEGLLLKCLATERVFQAVNTDSEGFSLEYVGEDIHELVIGSSELDTVSIEYGIDLISMVILRDDEVDGEYLVVPDVGFDGLVELVFDPEKAMDSLPSLQWSGLQDKPGISALYPFATQLNKDPSGNTLSSWRTAFSNQSDSVFQLMAKFYRSRIHPEWVTLTAVLSTYSAATLDMYKPVFVGGKRIYIESRIMQLDDREEVDIEIKGLTIRP